MATKTAAINKLEKADKYHVKVFCHLNDIVYAFQVVGPTETQEAVFSCRFYEGPGTRFTGYVQTETLPSDNCDTLRSGGSGATLDDLIHNIDWPHLPSELAKLKMLLAQCACTNSGALVGALVHAQLSAEKQSQRLANRESQVDALLTAHKLTLFQKATIQFEKDEALLREQFRNGLQPLLDAA